MSISEPTTSRDFEQVSLGECLYLNLPQVGTLNKLALVNVYI